MGVSIDGSLPFRGAGRASAVKAVRDMKSKFFGIGRLAAGATALAVGTGMGLQAWAEDKIGQPTDGAIDFQPGVTGLKQAAIHFHNVILLPIIVGISLLVLALLLWCVFRYNKRSNPIPARFTIELGKQI